MWGGLASRPSCATPRRSRKGLRAGLPARARERAARGLDGCVAACGFQPGQSRPRTQSGTRRRSSTVRRLATATLEGSYHGYHALYSDSRAGAGSHFSRFHPERHPIDRGPAAHRVQLAARHPRTEREPDARSPAALAGRLAAGSWISRRSAGEGARELRSARHRSGGAGASVADRGLGEDRDARRRGRSCETRLPRGHAVFEATAPPIRLSRWGRIRGSVRRVAFRRRRRAVRYRTSSLYTEAQIRALRAKHGAGLEEWWRQHFGFDFECLTRSEARYLENTPDADTVRSRIAAARSAGGAGSI
jgi:hypothetical protein